MQRGSQNEPVETPIEARQGFLDRPVLVVLVVSLVLIAAIFGYMVLKTWA